VRVVLAVVGGLLAVSGAGATGFGGASGAPRVDPPTHVGGVYAIAADTRGVWAGSWSDLYRLDPHTGRLVATIQLQSQWISGLLVYGTYVWVGMSGVYGNEVQRVSIARNLPVGRPLPVPAVTATYDLVGVGGRIYANGGMVIDARTGSVIRRATKFGWSPVLSGGTVWATQYRGASSYLERIDREGRTIGAGTRIPWGAVTGGAGSLLVYADPRAASRRRLIRFDPRTGRCLGSTPLRVRPFTQSQEHTGAFAAARGAFWVSSVRDNSVWAIDPKTGHILAHMHVRGGPFQMAFSGRNLWVADRYIGSITRIHLSAKGPP
jgi:outer membrane protein assembly factor BamB